MKPSFINSIRLVSFFQAFFISSLVFLTLSLYVKCTANYDFQTVDGENKEELIAGQSKSFFLKKEFSLTKPYHGPWNIGGSAVITNDFVRLTPDKQSRRGAVWSRLPVHIRNWEVHVSFRVHGTAGKHFGDGFAFWYVDPKVAFPGPLFGGQNNFRGLGVFLDTYSNALGPQGHFHPYVTPVINNGTVTIDQEADGRMKFGCTSRFRNRDHETLLAVRYVDNQLLVSTDVDNTGWRRCFRLQGVRLPTHFVFGLSAMTGDLTDNHDIIWVKVYEVESKSAHPDSSVNTKLIEPSVSDSLGSPEGTSGTAVSSEPGYSFGGAALCLLALSVAGLAWLAYLVYFGPQQKRKQRFY